VAISDFLTTRNVGRALGTEPGGRRTWVRVQQTDTVSIRCLLFCITTLTHIRLAYTPAPINDQRSVSPGTRHTTIRKTALEPPSFTAMFTQACKPPAQLPARTSLDQQAAEGGQQLPAGPPPHEGTAVTALQHHRPKPKFGPTLPGQAGARLRRGFSHSEAAALLAD